MTAIFPLFIISWGFLWTEITNMVPVVKKVFKLIFLIYIANEVKMTMKTQLNFSPGDKEIYNLLHDRSPILLEGSGLNRIESYFVTF